MYRFAVFSIILIAISAFAFATVIIPMNAHANPTVVNVSIIQGATTNQSSPGYSPATIRVVVGVNNTVQWTNNDADPHTVTAKSKSFDSHNLDPGQTFVFTFQTAGTFGYVCTYHPWMHGSVIVVAQSTTSTTTTTSSATRTSSTTATSTTTTTPVPEFPSAGISLLATLAIVSVALVLVRERRQTRIPS